MKKLVFVLVVISLTSFLFSCTSQPTPKPKTVKTVTVTEELDTQGFLISKEMVVRGNTVWGFSQKSYGTGTRWREIVSQNPFLQKPGRVYYDDGRKMWIVRIYPGEIVNIGGTNVTPTYSYTSEETTSEETTPVDQEASGIPWWGWLTILAVLAFLVWLFWFYRGGNGAMAWSNSSSAVHVNIMNNIDRETRAVLLGREQDRRDKIINTFRRDAKKNRIKGFIYAENDLFASADYRNTQKPKKQKGDKKDAKPEEQH